jgi:integrase
MRGTITETKPGTWRLRAVVGYRPDGQPRQASKTVYGTRRVAQTELAKFVAQAESNEAPMVGAMTLGAYLEQWMEHVRAHRQPDTTRNYAVKCRRFTAELGKVRLDKLRAHELDKLYRRWLAEGMSPTTVRTSHAVLSAALGQAVKWGLVSRSIAPLVTLPTVEQRRMAVPDADTVRLLIKESEESDPVLSAAIMLAALTGCRRGELLGLRWSDVDRDRMVLHVERSVKREETGRTLRIGPTKTHQNRRVSLDPVTLAVIDTHRERAEGWALDAVVAIDPDGYLLTEDPTGRTPMAPDTLTHRFSRLSAQLGLQGLRFHDLRHSVATNLLAAGYDLAIVAGRLGHRDPTITLRVYAHALVERDRQAAVTLGQLMVPTADPPT